MTDRPTAHNATARIATDRAAPDPGAATPLLLLDAGRALARLPGPVMQLDRNGRPIAANDAGAALAPTLATDGSFAQRLATTKATGAVATLALPVRLSDGADARQIELTLVPMADGTTLVIGRDATPERALRAALIESRQRYKDLVEVGSDFAWETDADGRFVFVSPKGALGFPASGLVGREAASLLDDPTVDAAACFEAAVPVADMDLWLRDAGGRSVCVVAAALPIVDAAGARKGARGICRDVTAERRRAEQLAAAERRERLITYIVRHMREEIAPAEMLGSAVEATRKALAARACAIFRIASPDRYHVAAEAGASEAVPDHPPRLIEANAPVDADGVLWVATGYRGIANGALALVGDRDWTAEDTALAADVGAQLGIALAQIENHDRLERLSRTDELTGLLNRRAFLEELGLRLRRLAKGGAAGALFYVDLDNFKLVNDRFGHQAGDEALRAVARQLAGRTRPGDLVARLGGDEFAIWMDRTSDAAGVQRASDILRDAAALVPLSGDPARPLGLSIGIAVYAPGSGEEQEAFVARADTAMYALKRSKKGGFTLAPPATATATAKDGTP